MTLNFAQLFSLPHW